MSRHRRTGRDRTASRTESSHTRKPDRIRAKTHGYAGIFVQGFVGRRSGGYSRIPGKRTRTSGGGQHSIIESIKNGHSAAACCYYSPPPEEGRLRDQEKLRSHI